MKLIIPLILFILFNVSCSKHEKICIKIEHIGIEDKPISHLVISNEPIDTIKPHITYCIVSIQTMSLLKENIMSYSFAIKNQRDKYFDFGSFVIELSIDNKLSKSFLLNNKKESMAFFEKFIEILKKNKSEEQIVQKFNYLLGRLKD